jgi:uncharacterized protein with ParB-like and HNH nuclease domain
MEFKFTPDHLAISDLFARDVKYIIPEYQRPYSWECLGKSDRNNQVNVMWEDLLKFYEGGGKGEYFFGSMVMIENESRTYQVIDGQQRLTTLVILFVAIKCFVIEIKSKKGILNSESSDFDELKSFCNELENTIDDIVYNKQVFGGLTKSKKVKIEKQAGVDYDKVLELVMECADFKAQKSFSDEYKENASRYFRNRQFLIEQLKDRFLNDGKFSVKEAEDLNGFLEAIKNHISVVRIITNNFESAYQIFEILNNRGLPLSNKDLFKNFFIKEFSKLKALGGVYADVSPTEKWSELEEDHDFRDDFLGRWVESRRGSQQQFSAYNDLMELYEKRYKDSLKKKKIELLYEDFKEDLGYYTLIVNPEHIENKQIRNKILWLSHAGNFRYTVDLLMALFRHTKFDGIAKEREEEIVTFIVEYEKHILDIQLSSGRRFSSAPVYEAINYLNKTDFGSASQIFVYLFDSWLIDEISLDYHDNNMGKLLLAKYFWWQDYTNNDVVEQKLDFGSATLEHISPQKPKTGSNWLDTKQMSKKFRNDFTYKLGNMTLLTQSMNSAAKNYDFKDKQKIYAKTNLAMTQELAHLENIHEAFFKKRHKAIVKGIMIDLRLTK